MDNLKPKEKDFTKEYIANGNNAKKAAKKVLPHVTDGSAGVLGHRMLKKVKENGLLEKYLPEKHLLEKHRQFLDAPKITRYFKKGEIETEVEEFDGTAVKALDMAYKLKGSYAPEKNMNVNVNVEMIPDEKLTALAEKLKDVQ